MDIKRRLAKAFDYAEDNPIVAGAVVLGIMFIIVAIALA